MKRVIILAEGQTEETFVNKILVPHYHRYDIFIKVTCICTKIVRSRRDFRGGHGRRYANIRNDLMRLLNDKTAYVTTMLDFYGLPEDFPGKNQAMDNDCFKNVDRIEKRFAEDIGNQRFIPNIILHEFEGLLFSQPEAVVDIIGDKEKVVDLLKIVNLFASPEEINDSPDTAPSKRLEKIFGIYRKTTHGPLISIKIGLETIRGKCRHFNQWLNKIESL